MKGSIGKPGESRFSAIPVVLASIFSVSGLIFNIIATRLYSSPDSGNTMLGRRLCLFFHHAPGSAAAVWITGAVLWIGSFVVTGYTRHGSRSIGLQVMFPSMLIVIGVGLFSYQLGMHPGQFAPIGCDVVH
jgi:hypothetical protein